jgi:NTP pyrophosphatase (non-canonical NTP hydrolase)
MDSKLYENLAMQFYHANKEHRHYNYLFHGLVEEAEEASEAETTEQVIEELGDVLWYVTIIASRLGYSLENLMIKNYNKLEARQVIGK